MQNQMNQFAHYIVFLTEPTRCLNVSYVIICHVPDVFTGLSHD